MSSKLFTILLTKTFFLFFLFFLLLKNLNFFLEPANHKNKISKKYESTHLDQRWMKSSNLYSIFFFQLNVIFWLKNTHKKKHKTWIVSCSKQDAEVNGKKSSKADEPQIERKKRSRSRDKEKENGSSHKSSK